MKIEKISDTQIKFILSKEDLKDRDLQLEELSAPTAKTQQLFREIMEQAMEECDFQSENVPLMVEAVPVALEGVMIIVTKLDSDEKDLAARRISIGSKDSHRFKRKSIEPLHTENYDNRTISIFSFSSLDDVINASIRLSKTYHGISSLYKMDKRYFLIVHSEERSGIDDVECILWDYGEKHVSSVLSKYYLIEHGEAIIENHAVKVLAENFI